MAVLPILHWPDPRLETRCAAVSGDVQSLAADMLDTMYEANGRGLAAPQIGVLLRLFVMDAGWKAATPAPMVLINPEIIWRGAKMATGPEGCLSLPGITAHVARHAELTLRWQDLTGSLQQKTMVGFEAICVQHELDHLDGILTLDRIDPKARAAAQAVLS